MSRLDWQIVLLACALALALGAAWRLTELEAREESMRVRHELEVVRCFARCETCALSKDPR